jgi:opacity protein-like surface antigen
VVFVLWVVTAAGSYAQPPAMAPTGRTELFGGFSYLIRNYQRGFASGGMPGWQASLDVPLRRSIGLAVEGAGYYQGNPYGSNFDLHFLSAGPQFSKASGGRTLFGEATVGIAHLNGATGPADTSVNVTIPRLAGNFAFAMTAGGGMEFRLTRRLRLRAGADYVYTNFTSTDNQIHGITNSNVRIAAGPVWRF